MHNSRLPNAQDPQHTDFSRLVNESHLADSSHAGKTSSLSFSGTGSHDGASMKTNISDNHSQRGRGGSGVLPASFNGSVVPRVGSSAAAPLNNEERRNSSALPGRRNRLSYLTAKSDFKYELKFYSLPPAPNIEPKLLDFSLQKNMFCDFKPTPIDVYNGPQLFSDVNRDFTLLPTMLVPPRCFNENGSSMCEIFQLLKKKPPESLVPEVSGSTSISSSEKLRSRSPGGLDDLVEMNDESEIHRKRAKVVSLSTDEQPTSTEAASPSLSQEKAAKDRVDAAAQGKPLHSASTASPPLGVSKEAGLRISSVNAPLQKHSGIRSIRASLREETPLSRWMSDSDSMLSTQGSLVCTQEEVLEPVDDQMLISPYKQRKELSTHHRSHELSRDPFSLSEFRHPTKPHLKCEQVIELLPQQKLWSSKYLQVGMEHSTDSKGGAFEVSNEEPLLLKLAQASRSAVSYTCYQRETNRQSATDSTPTSWNPDGVYNFTNNFTASLHEHGSSGDYYLLELPNPSQDSSKWTVGYYLPIGGRKVIFSKAGGAKKPPVRLCTTS